MCRVIRRKRTLPELSPIERARLIGTRAEQIEQGAETTLNSSQLVRLKKRVPCLSSIAIATEELRLKVIPLKVVRRLPSGYEEVWDVTEFYTTPESVREDIYLNDDSDNSDNSDEL